MSTNFFVGKLIPNDEVVGIGCVFDGDPKTVGPILLGSYRTRDRVNDLLSLGDLECLGDCPKRCVPYIPQDRVKPEAAHWFKDINAAIYHWIGFEYAYIYIPDAAKWFVIDTIGRYGKRPRHFTIEDAALIDMSMLHNFEPVFQERKIGGIK